jgi:hypothetical protein
LREAKAAAMDKRTFYKCPCKNCSGRIEFPEDYAGETIACPHCQTPTLLDLPVEAARTSQPQIAAIVSAPVPATAHPTPRAAEARPETATAILRPSSQAMPKSKTKKLVLTCIAIIVILAPLAVMVVIRSIRADRAEQSANDGSASTSNAEAPPAGPTVEPVRGEGELQALEVRDYSVQKAGSGNLLYVTGTVTNHSGGQFFKVKIEFALSDADGGTAGEASDYQGSIAGHGAWNFRATILAKNATKAKLKSISGEKE